MKAKELVGKIVMAKGKRKGGGVAYGQITKAENDIVTLQYVEGANALCDGSSGTKSFKLRESNTDFTVLIPQT